MFKHKTMQKVAKTTAPVFALASKKGLIEFPEYVSAYWIWQHTGHGSPTSHEANGKKGHYGQAYDQDGRTVYHKDKVNEVIKNGAGMRGGKLKAIYGKLPNKATTRGAVSLEGKAGGNSSTDGGAVKLGGE